MLRSRPSLLRIKSLNTFSDYTSITFKIFEDFNLILTDCFVETNTIGYRLYGWSVCPLSVSMSGSCYLRSMEKVWMMKAFLLMLFTRSAHWSKELLWIAYIDRPSVGCVWLVDWCASQPIFRSTLNPFWVKVFFSGLLLTFFKNHPRQNWPWGD